LKIMNVWRSVSVVARIGRHTIENGSKVIETRSQSGQTIRDLNYPLNRSMTIDLFL